MKLQFNITDQFQEIHIAEGEYSHLLNLISWEEQPFFPVPGRVAWYAFRSKPYLSVSNEYFQSAKLKGVGIWNPRGYNGYSGIHDGEEFSEPHPPTTLEYKYTSRTEHFGITKAGEYAIVHSEPAPFGGITHCRAFQEYDNASKLLARKVSVTVPFIVAKYSSLLFKDQELGVIVSLLQDQYPFRLQLLMFDRSKLLEQQQGFVGQVYQSSGVHADSRCYSDQMIVISKLYNNYGQVLRDFALAGFYRHSGGLDNLYYNCKTSMVYLTDLDSSQDLHELPESNRPLQILRDFSSVLYKFLYRLCRPDLINFHRIDILREFDPLGKAISGFFPDVDQSKIEATSSSLWDYFFPMFYVVKKYSSNDAFKFLVSEYIERDFFFVLAITKMYNLYIKSSINQVYPCTETLDQMLAKAKNYLQERYAFLYQYFR